MTATRWLSPEEREAWLALVSIMFTLPGSIEAQLQAEADLSLAEYLVLAMLSEAPDRRRRMSELATVTNTSQSRLSRIVGRLERDGLVVRTGDAKDKRVVLAEITDRGLGKVEEVAPGHVEHVRRTVIDRLTPEQVRQLALIGRVVDDAADVSVLGTVGTAD
ncbi:MarR family transcriptional regulator [Kocuria flava]|uniref:MarR family transcriptional regulator n=1 Tax=Kocuria flava TaxID=446860 RepID=A0A0U2NX66_9MICC|nr:MULTISPECIES: MarR family transcriptional regulator [Kocuria]ALU38829.1 MarR family transcriptional regulator [Kocuria flava]MCD1144356.1 MarR family transcriptional regulator [Kocuria sp. LUK]PLC11558.1 MarR family transcriptional regulator [Kocuria flava]GEO91849.1 MarR family transcriptional regulator [Kocuria flava]